MESLLRTANAFAAVRRSPQDDWLSFARDSLEEPSFEEMMTTLGIQQRKTSDPPRRRIRSKQPPNEPQKEKSKAKQTRKRQKKVKPWKIKAEKYGLKSLVTCDRCGKEVRRDVLNRHRESEACIEALKKKRRK